MKSDEEIKNDALVYIKKKSSVRFLVEKFASSEKIPREAYPVSVFMAGSPGAGKTEFSKQLISMLWEGEENRVVRIDADEIREFLPGYTGENAHIFQYPASVGVDKLHDSVLKHGQNFILDGTLTDFDRAKANIERSLNKGRKVVIFYIYQEPVTAWDFTVQREKVEHRKIQMDTFIGQFFEAKEVVNALKQFFEKRITVHLVEKDFKHEIIQFRANIDKIDNHVKVKYTQDTLRKYLGEYGND